jgi:hypothetical protein
MMPNPDHKPAPGKPLRCPALCQWPPQRTGVSNLRLHLLLQQCRLASDKLRHRRFLPERWLRPRGNDTFTPNWLRPQGNDTAKFNRLRPKRQRHSFHQTNCGREATTQPAPSSCGTRQRHSLSNVSGDTRLHPKRNASDIFSNHDSNTSF